MSGTGTTSTPRPVGVLGRRTATVNLVAQALALACLAIATLAVARSSGPAVTGEYALLRVLPWLTGVVCSAGLPVASTYHLAGARGADPRVRPTLTALAVAGALVGVVVWSAAVPVANRLLFPDVPRPLLLLAGATVTTQLLTVWGKACCQGVADMRGANLVIVVEELAFLPAFGGALAVGLSGIHAVVAALLGGGVLAAAVAMGRLATRGFFAGWRRPSADVARGVVVFGTRAQLGNLLWLVNLRFDFLMLGVLAGPATLGVYAIASKFTELMRLPATACQYVLYPRFARADRTIADLDARRLLPRALALTAAIAPVTAATAVLVPWVYGSAFDGAVVVSWVLVVGLAAEGATAVASAYLWGIGRPGANSAAMGAGVTVTILLCLLLIPRHGAVGAAVASSAAYLTTAAVLVFLTARLTGRRPTPGEMGSG